MLAKDLLRDKGEEVVTVALTATLDNAIAVLAKHNIGAVIVRGESQGISGILSERDIVRVLSGAPVGFRETSVAEIMTKTVFTASTDATIDELLDLMTEKRIRHVPVVEGDKLRGILSIGDVVKHRIREAVGEAEALKHYIYG